MKDALHDELPKFYDFIELNKNLTPDQTIQKLSYYHNSNRENILKSFPNIETCVGWTVSFRESVNSGYACIIMEGYDKSGQRQWSELIDKYSGQPMMRCG